MEESPRSFNKPRGFIDSLREINAKYRTPRIKMTPMVKLSLLALRIYLILMLLILFAKFISVVIVH
jgi:hypothetical protein